jgi:thioredoxin 2
MAAAATDLIVECRSCHARNRVSKGGAANRLPVCGRCGKPLILPDAKPVLVTDANFAEVVGNSTMPVLLDMWAAWCGPCRMIAPVIEELAAELNGRLIVGKCDVDANPSTASRFRVQSIPTLLIPKDGREMERIVGLQSKTAIIQHLKPYIT